MNRFFSNIFLFASIPLFTLVISLIASFCTKDWTWFSRSGSVMTMAGVILSVRPIIRMTFNQYGESKKIIDGGSILGDTPKEIAEDKEERNDLVAIYIGGIFKLLGTLIWGYGDLITKLYS